MMNNKKLDAYTIVETDCLYGVGGFEHIASGWRLDNRGGIPRRDADKSGEFKITDISKDLGTAMIREVNVVKEGVVTLETRVTVSGDNTDGVFLEFRTSEDKVLYHIIFEGCAWKYLCSDGKLKDIYSAEDDEKAFSFKIIINLENKTSVTYINGKASGTLPLAVNDGVDIQNFRYGTTDESTASYAVTNVVRLYANYGVNDDFNSWLNADGMPIGYDCKNVSVANSQLDVEKDGYAVKDFDDLSGIVITEAEMLMADGMRVCLSDTEASVIEIFVDGGKLYANGCEVYEYHTDIWYRLRIEADTNTGNAVIKLNGRKITDISFEGEKVNRITFANAGKKCVSYDTVRVYEKIIHEDYVPKPVVPKGNDKYNIGINICSLWRNGHHIGWGPISPYEEPYLGYYDEGNPETADWEIKYMVEHGIDFQSFCWYPDKKDAPFKNLECRYHLHDGFMNAEYSHMMKYCLIWECVNARTPKGMENWKKYFVPYLIENYFKDPRYKTIDNRLVFCVFGAGKLNEADAFGSWMGTRDAFDYLNEEVKKLGFDGMFYLALGTSNETLALMHFDASYAYSWSRDGYRVEHNKKSMLDSYNITDKMYTVPTTSVGFNDIAWWGARRQPLMTVEDYRTVNEWVRDEYLPKYGTKGTWKENLVMLSTWNEYGEGTYIMPSKNNGGFGYLDVLRETYTDEKADASLNTVPSASQRERITRLYPSHHSLVKYQDYYKPEEDENVFPTFRRINADEMLSVSSENITDFRVTETNVSGKAEENSNFVLDVKDGENLSITAKMKVKMKMPVGNFVYMYFTTDEDNEWTEEKRFLIKSTSDDMREYVINPEKNEKWKGTLEKLKFDFSKAAGVSFEIEGVGFNTFPVKKVLTVNVDGVDRVMRYPSRYSENGEYLLAFDTIFIPDIFATYSVWDKYSKSLTINAGKHTVVFTIDYDTYFVDGKEMPLGFKLYENDGLIMLPLKKLCDAVGFNFREDAEEVFVETTRKV